jgi:hypothetical protein
MGFGAPDGVGLLYGFIGFDYTAGFGSCALALRPTFNVSDKTALYPYNFILSCMH